MRDDERLIEDGDLPAGMPADDTPADLVDQYDVNEDGRDYDEAADEEPLAEGESGTGFDAEPAVTEAERPCEAKFPAPVFNNFMDALYPAHPPAAKNVRIVRRFDLEAAKYDTRPASMPGSAPAPEPEPIAAAPKPEKKEPEKK